MDFGNLLLFENYVFFYRKNDADISYNLHLYSQKKRIIIFNKTTKKKEKMIGSHKM